MRIPKPLREFARRHIADADPNDSPYREEAPRSRRSVPRAPDPAAVLRRRFAIARRAVPVALHSLSAPRS